MNLVFIWIGLADAAAIRRFFAGWGSKGSGVKVSPTPAEISPEFSSVCPLIYLEFVREVAAVAELGFVTASKYMLSSSRLKMGKMGEISLGKHVASTSSVSVYFAGRDSAQNLVVKHMNDCVERVLSRVIQNKPLNPSLFQISSWQRNSDPTLLTAEFALSRVLRDTGLVPSVVWASGLVPFNAKNEFGFGLTRERASICAKLGTTVRTIVEIRHGPTVREILHSRSEKASEGDKQMEFLREVILVAKKTLGLLEPLHAAGFIHGDIHDKNVALEDRNAGLEDDSVVDKKLILIDLGLGAIVCGDSAALRSPDSVSYTLASPWQLTGLRGYRDDVFRVLEMMARQMSFGELEMVEKRLEERVQSETINFVPVLRLSEFRREFSAFKKSFNFFSHSSTTHPYYCFEKYDSLSELALDFLEAQLGCLWRYMQSVPSHDSRIDYRLFERRLDTLLSLGETIPDDQDDQECVWKKSPLTHSN